MSDVRVPSRLYFQSRMFAVSKSLWRWLADLESRIVHEEIAELKIDRPIYVAGLARAGTTIVTEMLAQHPHLTCHRYSDFPNVWTPYWRNYLLDKSRIQAPKLVERAHQDRIQINNDSPEAVEEVLWMHFFPSRHDATAHQLLDGETLNLKFDLFYTKHILKLLAVRKANRYLAKNNYNISRLRYLLELNPDAKFLIPVRDPRQQIASLAKQQALFTRASQDDHRIPLQMAMSGHFEFGPLRIPINFGDPKVTQSIINCWNQGREVAGWARYWADSYQHISQQLETYPEIRKACLLYRYEDLCAHSERMVDAILNHCELPQSGFESFREEYIARLSPPDYYQWNFSHQELEEIAYHCDPVNEKLSMFCQNP